jgi:hypothetical protein
MIQVLRVDAYDKRKFAYDPKPEVMFEVPIDPPEQMEGGGKRNKKGKHCHNKCGKKWEACEWIISRCFFVLFIIMREAQYVIGFLILSIAGHLAAAMLASR